MENQQPKSSMLFADTPGKRWLAVALCVVAACPLWAQQYTIVPNDSIVSVAPFNDVTHFNITQTNVSGNKLVFSWQQLEQSVPVGWIVNLCDNGFCYTTLPLNGTMDTVYNGDVGLMSIGIDPGEINGTAIIRYALWEHHTPDKVDTLTWMITAGTTGITELSTLPSLNIYPNPASDFITVSVHAPLLLTITDMSGKQVFSKTLHAGLFKLPVSSLPNGQYIITANDNKQLLTHPFTIQH